MQPGKRQLSSEDSLQPGRRQLSSDDTLQSGRRQLSSEDTLQPGRRQLSSEDTLQPGRRQLSSEDSLLQGRRQLSSEDTWQPGRRQLSSEDTLQPGKRPPASIEDGTNVWSQPNNIRQASSAQLSQLGRQPADLHQLPIHGSPSRRHEDRGPGVHAVDRHPRTHEEQLNGVRHAVHQTGDPTTRCRSGEESCDLHQPFLTPSNSPPEVIDLELDSESGSLRSGLIRKRLILEPSSEEEVATSPADRIGSPAGAEPDIYLLDSPPRPPADRKASDNNELVHEENFNPREEQKEDEERLKGIFWRLRSPPPTFATVTLETPSFPSALAPVTRETPSFPPAVASVTLETTLFPPVPAEDLIHPAWRSEESPASPRLAAAAAATASAGWRLEAPSVAATVAVWPLSGMEAAADRVRPGETMSSPHTMTVKPRGPAQGFFNRDRLQQFPFFNRYTLHNTRVCQLKKIRYRKFPHAVCKCP